MKVTFDELKAAFNQVLLNRGVKAETELSAMYDELEEIRSRSMAMDKEENELGVSCIAVPVFDIHGRVPYAISISLSTSRMKQVGEKNLLKPLRETAEAISQELGFTVRG